MKRFSVAAVAAVLSLPVLVAVAGTGSSRAAVPPVHAVTVTGVGAAMYPAFDPVEERYAVTTTGDTGGTLTVTAATTDPAGVVRINGRVDTDGSRTLTGLMPGDEISILITDVAGTAVHSLFYLPVGFPELRRRAGGPDNLDTPSPGMVLLTLGLPSSSFEAAVDANGVPVVVHANAGAAVDFKRQPNGNYSVARRVSPTAGYDVVELDAQFREIARHRTVGLRHTDNHDSILLPDGSRYLLAYEPDEATGYTDAVIQHVDASGAVIFEWNSSDHVDIAAETVTPGNPDYAHVNSLEVLTDGDLLASFRHLSSVFKIARHSHDGFQQGEVVWKLGGRASDFTFVDTDGAPDGGPCAQHTATELPNGNIMVFDNGAWQPGPLCIDPADPPGPPVWRLPTRIAEWSLDPATGVATMIDDFQVDQRYTLFAGSARRLENGNTLIGWGSMRAAVASEVDPLGSLAWELVAVGSPQDFTYRAFKSDVPDAIAPDVAVTSPVNGASYAQGAAVAPVYDCTDRGGSSLRTCTAGELDTSTPGTRTVAFTGTDGAGNSTSVTRSYTVLTTPAPPVPPASPPVPIPSASTPTSRPDAMIRLRGEQDFVGEGEYGARQRVHAALHRPRASATAVIRVRNEGSVADRVRLLVRVFGRKAAFRTSVRMSEGRRFTRLLQPGESWTVRVRVTRRVVARPLDAAVVRVRSRSLSTDAGDAVSFRVRAR